MSRVPPLVSPIPALLAGTGLVALQRGAGQVLLFLATLLAARRMTPEVMGGFGLVVSTGSLLGMLASLRFEVVALRCRSAGAQRRFVGLATAAALASTILTGVVLLACSGAGLLPDRAPWMWLPPIMLACSLGQSIAPAQMTAAHELRRLGRAAQTGAGATALLQIAAAFTLPSAGALAGARALGLAAGLAPLRPALGGAVSALRGLRLPGLRRALRLAWTEIALGTPAALFSVLSAQIPVYVFAALGHQEAVGAYWLGFNLLMVPYQIVAAGFRPLFLRLVARERDPGQLAALLLRATLAAGALGVLGMLGLTAAAHLLIRNVLGGRWDLALSLLDGLAIMLAGLILQTPASAAIPALGLQAMNLAYTAAQTGLRAVALVLTYGQTGSISAAVTAFGLAGALASAVQAGMVLHGLRRRAERGRPAGTPLRGDRSAVKDPHGTAPAVSRGRARGLAPPA